MCSPPHVEKCQRFSWGEQPAHEKNVRRPWGAQTEPHHIPATDKPLHEMDNREPQMGAQKPPYPSVDSVMEHREIGIDRSPLVEKCQRFPWGDQSEHSSDTDLQFLGQDWVSQLWNTNKDIIKDSPMNHHTEAFKGPTWSPPTQKTE